MWFMRQKPRTRPGFWIFYFQFTLCDSKDVLEEMSTQCEDIFQSTFCDSWVSVYVCLVYLPWPFNPLFVILWATYSYCLMFLLVFQSTFCDSLLVAVWGTHRLFNPLSIHFLWFSRHWSNSDYRTATTLFQSTFCDSQWLIMWGSSNIQVLSFNPLFVIPLLCLAQCLARLLDLSIHFLWFVSLDFVRELIQFAKPFNPLFVIPKSVRWQGCKNPCWSLSIHFLWFTNHLVDECSFELSSFQSTFCDSVFPDSYVVHL